MDINKETPVEKYYIDDVSIYVKRDDLAYTDKLSPPFSKIRGLYKVMLSLKEKCVKTVGYMLGLLPYQFLSLELK